MSRNHQSVSYPVRLDDRQNNAPRASNRHSKSIWSQVIPRVANPFEEVAWAEHFCELTGHTRTGSVSGSVRRSISIGNRFRPIRPLQGSPTCGASRSVNSLQGRVPERKSVTQLGNPAEFWWIRAYVRQLSGRGIGNARFSKVTHLKGFNSSTSLSGCRWRLLIKIVVRNSRPQSKRNPRTKCPAAKVSAGGRVSRTLVEAPHRRLYVRARSVLSITRPRQRPNCLNIRPMPQIVEARLRVRTGCDGSNGGPPRVFVLISPTALWRPEAAIREYTSFESARRSVPHLIRSGDGPEPCLGIVPSGLLGATQSCNRDWPRPVSAADPICSVGSQPREIKGERSITGSFNASTRPIDSDGALNLIAVSPPLSVFARQATLRTLFGQIAILASAIRGTVHMTWPFPVDRPPFLHPSLVAAGESMAAGEEAPGGTLRLRLPRNADQRSFFCNLPAAHRSTKVPRRFGARFARLVSEELS